MKTKTDTPARLISWPDAQARTGLSKTTLWRLTRAKRFPQPINLEGTRRSVFVEAEVDSWIAARIAARDARGAAA